MTIGIYSLYLGESNKYYIGQSSNIEERATSHKSMLKNNRHYNYKLQLAYNITNSIEIEILESSNSTKGLYEKEAYYIKEFDSISNGYNIASAGIVGRGLNHPSTVYTKEQLIEVFMLCLDPSVEFKDISSITGVSISTIRHISRREVHSWLGEMYPEEDKILVELKNSKIRSSSIRTNKEYKYRSMVSPDGSIYNNIFNCCEFARQHNLDNNKIREVLKGTRVSYKGWKATDNGR